MKYFHQFDNIDVKSIPQDILATTIHFSGMEATLYDWLTDFQLAVSDDDGKAVRVLGRLEPKYTNSLITRLFDTALNHIKLPRNKLLTAGQLKKAITNSTDSLMLLTRLLYSCMNSGYDFTAFSDRFNRFLKRAVNTRAIEYHPQTTTYQAKEGISGQTVTKTRVKNLYKLL